MKRIFPKYAYGSGPRQGCWWDETAVQPRCPVLAGDTKCDVAIVGGGFTGVSAALYLARRGSDVVVVDAHSIGWGASGRNGGFCCVGGGMRSDASLDKRYGITERRAWRRTERAAVDRVDTLIRELGLDVDRHSNGETCLAHRSRAFAGFDAEARAIEENYGVSPEVLPASRMAAAGLSGPFYGALTLPIGFGLNPRKFLNGMIEACRTSGVRFFDNSPAVQIAPGRVQTPKGDIKADKIIVATNGYSSEDIPEWLAARYMPAQSTVIVTRPLENDDLAAQGWTSGQMAYDTRRLLHYFRLLPDRRFLFGMRGGLRSGVAAERAARAAVERDFRAMFRAWSEVEVTHAWSGLVCLSRDFVPFVGAVPDMPGVFAGFAYHGNGVAMGTHAGAVLADLVSGERPDNYPSVMSQPAGRFPLGSVRRLLMPAIYSAFRLRDALP
ncbi:MAG: FAD-binding oxidoreductase [Pseudomonadota bacterium]